MKSQARSVFHLLTTTRTLKKTPRTLFRATQATGPRSISTPWQQATRSCRKWREWSKTTRRVFQPSIQMKYGNEETCVDMQASVDGFGDPGGCDAWQGFPESIRQQTRASLAAALKGRYVLKMRTTTRRATRCEENWRCTTSPRPTTMHFSEERSMVVIRTSKFVKSKIQRLRKELNLQK